MSGAREEVERLRASTDEAAKNARNIFLVFLLVGLYVAIFIGSTTDEQLLRGAGVVLPLLDVALPIAGVYAIVPPIFVVLHYNLLQQLYLLSRKLHRLDQAIEGLDSGAERDEARDLVYPFAFCHMIVGHHHGLIVRALIYNMMWLTVAALPIALLLWAQMAFLPYHGNGITWISHRGAVVLDDLMGRARPTLPRLSFRSSPIPLAWKKLFSTPYMAIPHLKHLLMGLQRAVIHAVAVRPA